MCGNMPGAASPAPTVGTPATPKPVAPVAEPRNFTNMMPKVGALPGTPAMPGNLPKSPAWNAMGLPKMHKGGTIPETGPYVMKKGEKVLTPDHQRDLIAAFESVKKALSEPASESDGQPAKELQSMTIKRDKKDPTRFVVSHKSDGKTEEHSTDGKELAAHVAKHWQLDKDTDNDKE
jgi:hypothetical protein